MRNRVGKPTSLKWGDPRYGELHAQTGMDSLSAIRKARQIMGTLEGKFPYRTILLHDLNNPFMEEHARTTLMNDVRRHMRRAK